MFPWDMKEITAGLRKTQWRRKVRIRGGRGPAGRRGLLSQTGRAPPERDPGFQRRPWPGPSASLGI